MACGLFFSQQGPLVAQRIEIEELQPGQQGCERTLGHAQVIADVEDVLLDLSFGESIRRDHVLGGQLANGAKILPPGPLDQSGEPHVLDHAVAEF